MVKIRCPVCNGTGCACIGCGFGGYTNTSICPACNGTGLQEVSDDAWLK